jgi:hypothetical protein
VLFTIKHQILAYLPASYGYMEWHHFSAVVLAFNLLARFFVARVAYRCALVPANDPGRFLLWPSSWRTKYLLYYVEPALLLGFLLYYRVSAPPYSLRFVPMFWLDKLPLPYGIVQPYPVWYVQNAITIAFWLPFLTLPALWLHNRLEYATSEEGQREADARRKHAPVTTEQPPVFTPVTLSRRG